MFVLRFRRDRTIRCTKCPPLEDWWLPDEIALVQSMPLAATGKIDKKELRADYASGGTESRPVVR
jgi:non-ribosomal peptide synthetase component E (peptide arylation enzyme)